MLWVTLLLRQCAAKLIVVDQHALHFFLNGLVAPVGAQRRIGCHLRPIKSHYPQLHQTRFMA